MLIAGYYEQFYQPDVTFDRLYSFGWVSLSKKCKQHSNAMVQDIYEEQATVQAWIKIYMFDFDVSSIHRLQQELEPEQRKRFKIPNNEPLPMYVYNRLPFASFMNRQKNNATWVGCHAIQGSIQLQAERKNN